MTAIVFKTLSAISIIVVLSLNGVLNDIFVAYFFFVTSVSGQIYFKFSGF
jgi:hypothetical protein